MPRSSARRRCAALLPLIVLIAACGRVSGEGAATPEAGLEAVSDDSIIVPVVDSPMLSSPAITVWTGGDPALHLDEDQTRDVLHADATAIYDPDLHPGLAGECYSDAQTGGDREVCLYPALRRMGVSEDAIRFFEENGLVVTGMVGSGPVAVADLWWGPAGPMALTPAAIFIPGGYMSAAPLEWEAYATVVQQAYDSEGFRRIALAAMRNDPMTFSDAYATFIEPPIAIDGGWTVYVTNVLADGFVEFAGRFALHFSADGQPDGASFVSFCHLAEFEPNRAPGFDMAGIDALRAELPACPERRFATHGSPSVIDWSSSV